MNYPPYWNAPPFYPQSGVIYVPTPTPPVETAKPKEKSLDDMINEYAAAEATFKRLKKSLQEEKKDEEKKDDKKKKSSKFEMSLGDIFTLLMIGSIPAIWIQHKLINAAAALITSVH